jgi:hypothetical protein
MTSWTEKRTLLIQFFNAFKYFCFTDTQSLLSPPPPFGWLVNVVGVLRGGFFVWVS